MADRTPRCDRLCGRDNRVGVDAIVSIKVSEGARLTEMLDAQRPRAMTGDCAKPGKCCRMAVEHRDDSAVRRDFGEQAFDMRTRVNQSALARTLSRSPAGIKAVG